MMNGASSSHVPYTDEISVISLVCRICYDTEKDEELITPCNCKGTVAFVHRSCLETWLGESNTSTCELCHQAFNTERTPKYSSAASICYWCWRTNGLSREARSDVLACTIITPLIVIVTYVCLFSSEYYNQIQFSSVPAARWTSVSLLVMIGIMLIGYYVWVYSAIRMHARRWYNWWQRTCNVRYIAPGPVRMINRGQTNVHLVNEKDGNSVTTYVSTVADNDAFDLIPTNDDSPEGRNEEIIIEKSLCSQESAL